MMKCRQFGEALTERAFIQFGLPKMPSAQCKRLKVLKAVSTGSAAGRAAW
jgi:type I restriction enzyme R subunit